MTVYKKLIHARSKILLLTLGKMLLTFLLQLKVRPAVVSMIDSYTALVDRQMMNTFKMYMYMIQKIIHGVESMSTQLQVVK